MPPDRVSMPSIRGGAERSLLLMIVAFVVAVVGTRWFLQATGYPQVGGGELHIAHMLWGGLLLLAAVLVALVVSAPWATDLAAVAAGAGTGLFIDEIGKFITASNDYFYPLAVPLIYGLLLAIALLYLVLRHRPGGRPVIERPGSIARWEERHLARSRYRRLLAVMLLGFGLVWVVILLAYLSLDSATIRDLIATTVTVPGDPVERPDDPIFYLLEAAFLGASGVLLVVGGILLARAHDRAATTVALIGLVVTLTAGTLVSLYVEQISAMSATVLNAALLFAVVHYRNRFVVDGAG